jgi:hypothetical protein
MQALLLAVRLWGRLPADLVAACPLLPPGCSRPPPPTLFTAPSASAGKAAGPAAAALFSVPRLQVLVPALRGSTHSHPRLHSVWPTLLALLVPGFNPDKVGRAAGQQAPPPDCVIRGLGEGGGGVLGRGGELGLGICWHGACSRALVSTCADSFVYCSFG